MRKVSARIAWYALTSVNIVMVLGACMKPVDVEPFLNDEKVQEIINKDKGVNIDLGFENPANISPVLQASIGGTTSPVAEDSTVTVSLGSLSSATITVTNTTDYDTIKWYYNFNLVVTGAAINLGDSNWVAIFNAADSYPVTVIGITKGGSSNGTLFYVDVGN